MNDKLYELTIIVTNSNDESCQRLRWEETHEVGLDADVIHTLVEAAEQRFRGMFPKGMSYTVPFTTANVRPVGIVNDEGELLNSATAMRLLKQAYASGQLQDSIVGGMIERFFGVPYTEIDAPPYSDPDAQTVSVGAQSTFKGETTHVGPNKRTTI